MIEEFWDWLKDVMVSLCDTIVKVAWFCIAILLVIITFPLWIIPFLYWYFRKWKKDKEPET